MAMTDPAILPWPEMAKKAERDGVDIMDYVNSMHAHVLNQRDALARQNKQIQRLRTILRGIASCATCGVCQLAAQSAFDVLCEHEWVSARNEVVTSGEICKKCYAIRAEGTRT
jgi:hypothetical protein